MGNLPDGEFDDPPQTQIVVPKGQSSNAIAYGDCIVTESIDKSTSCYDVDDSGTLIPSSDCDE